MLRRGRSPYLPATRPHLVRSLFGHAAADPGHARHLAAAVHGLQLKGTSRYRLAPSSTGTPTDSQPALSAQARVRCRRTAHARALVSASPRPLLTSFQGAEWERGGERGGSGSSREGTPRGWVALCDLNGLFRTVPRGMVSAGFMEAINKTGTVGVRGGFS